MIAVLNENQAILLTAYNSGTITYMDPAIGSLTTVSHEAMTELMASSGNTFLGYIK